MTKIKTLYDTEGNKFVPRTHVKAVTDDNGNSLASILDQKVDDSELAEVKSIAETARNAVATLEGLSNTTTAQETLAAQVTQIEENKQNIALNKAQLDINTNNTSTNTSRIQALEDSVQMFYAAGRDNGDADPDFQYFYGNKDSLTHILSHFKTGTFKNGKLQHECAKGRITLASNGDEVPIDGTDGDVLIYTDTDIYFLRTTVDVNGIERNIIGLGLTPFMVEGVAAKKFEPFAFTPHYTVNTKLDGDYRSCAHSIYNPSVNGTYNAPVAFFKQTFKTSGGGYPSQYISSINSSIQAQNKNEDAATKTPYMGLYYEFYEIWMAAMYLELSTLNFVPASKMGYGCTATAANVNSWADTAISGISGIKLIQSNDTTSYLSLNNNKFKLNSSATATYALDGLVGSSRYVFTEMLEGVRILDTIKKSGLSDKIGASTNIFTDGGATCISDGSVDLSTGVGMESNKKYYTVRHVPGCETDVMTAVVNIYIKMDVVDGVYCDTTDITGAACIFKFSHPIYRGLDLLSGMFTNLEGLHYTIYNEGGVYYNRFYAADKYSDVPVVTSSYKVYDVIGTEFTQLKGLRKRIDGQKAANGWAKTSDYKSSLFNYLTIGGGQATYECAHVWRSNCWGQGTNGLPADGYECVNASCVGCSAANGFAGRFLVASYAAMNTAGYFAGGFALPLIEIK